MTDDDLCEVSTARKYMSMDEILGRLKALEDSRESWASFGFYKGKPINSQHMLNECFFDDLKSLRSSLDFQGGSIMSILDTKDMDIRMKADQMETSLHMCWAAVIFSWIVALVVAFI